MRAVCWQGINKLTTETVPDPVIRNDQDVILRVRLSTTCGSDLHLIGYDLFKHKKDGCVRAVFDPTPPAR